LRILTIAAASIVGAGVGYVGRHRVNRTKSGTTERNGAGAVVDDGEIFIGAASPIGTPSRSRVRLCRRPPLPWPACACEAQPRDIPNEATEPIHGGVLGRLERDHQGAPSAIQELARGDISVVCTPPEANAALEWARNQPLWSDDTPAVAIDDT
jgi:hypothetical protein